MDETPTALLLGGVVLLILLAVGVFVATLVYLQRAQAAKQRRNTRPRRPRVSTAESPPSVEESAPQAPRSAVTPGEVMRVIRDESTGRVLIEVEGRRYAHIKEIKDARIGRQVLWTIADLIRFTGGMVANPQALRAAKAESKPTTDTGGGRIVAQHEPKEKVVSPPPTAGEAASRPSPAMSSPLAATSASSSLPQHRYNIVDFFRRGFQPREPVEPLPKPTSFVDEIEDILQRRIAERTTPLPYSVHVRTGPSGLLQIVIGVEVYDSADEIPYPEIKALIKAAVAEWERR